MPFKDFLYKQMFACAPSMLALTGARLMALTGGVSTLWAFVDLAVVVIFLLNQHYLWRQVRASMTMQALNRAMS